MKVSCPTCGVSLQAPDTAIGKTVKCPKCRNRFTTPRPSLVESALGESTSGAQRQAASVPARAPATVEATQQCPFCGSEIPSVAKKCRECGETIDLALRAADEARRAANEAKRYSRRGGGGNQQQVVIHEGYRGPRYVKSFPHVLHLVLTLLTCGIWLPVWIVHYVIWSLLH